MEFAKWLVKYHIKHNIEPTFEYNVHSMNPIGAENIRSIRSYIQQYKDIKGV